MSLISKIHPANFPQMPPKFAALLGYVVGEEFTTNTPSSVIVTLSGELFATFENELEAEFFGREERFLKWFEELIYNARLYREDRAKLWDWVAQSIVFKDRSGRSIWKGVIING